MQTYLLSTTLPVFTCPPKKLPYYPDIDLSKRLINGIFMNRRIKDFGCLVYRRTDNTLLSMKVAAVEFLED